MLELWLETWFPFVFCFLAYFLSIFSLGRWSVTHGWLFTGLCVWTWTESSLAQVHQGTRRRETTRPTRTLDELLRILKCVPTSIGPGVIVRTILERSKSFREQYVFQQASSGTPPRTSELDIYKAVDLATVWCLGCLVRLMLQWTTGWYRFFMIRQGEFCDMECWTHEWERYRPNDWPLCCLLLVGCWLWWSLAWQAAHISNSFIAPSAYGTAVVFALAAWTATCHTNDLPLFPPILDLRTPVQELAVRSLLWLRLAGFDTLLRLNERILLDALVVTYRGLFALLCGSVGLALSEAVAAVHTALVNRFCCVSMEVPSMGLLDRFRRALWRIMALTAALIPAVGLWAYYHAMNRWQRLWIHSAVGWSMTVVLLLLSKSFLASYLQEAVAVAVRNLKRADRGSHQDSDLEQLLTYPFARRIANLPRQGAKVACLPVFLVLLLTLGMFTCPPSEEIYPSGMGGHLRSDSISNRWESAHIENWIALEANRTDAIAWLSPWYHRTSRNKTTISFGVQLVDVSSASDPTHLLQSTALPSMTLIEALQRMRTLVQRSASDRTFKQALEHRPVEHLNKEARQALREVEDAKERVLEILYALVKHPLATRSSIFPFLHFLTYVLNVYWFWSLGWTMVTVDRPPRDFQRQCLLLMSKSSK